MPDTLPFDGPLVIIGGGHAAAQLCGALHEAGAGARVHLVCEEPALPYQRPPLSKGFLKNPAEAPALLRAEAWYAEAGIHLHRADPAVAIDRGQAAVTLRSGLRLPYGRLVLATGARPRRLPALPEALANVVALRSAADAQGLRDQLAAATQVAVLGGGFIGLEVAATARALGKPVLLLEMAPRLLGRSVSAALAEHVLATHRANGIDLRLGVADIGFEHDGQRLAALVVAGQRMPVDLLVMGIGASPDTALAIAAGLAVDNGIVVDAQMRSSDPAILAIGDCANFPEAGSGRRLRLESVQNANDQARCAAATLLGREAAYTALPWFWSEQGGLRLQMAGLLPTDPVTHRRPGANANSFSLLHYVGEHLACVESVNAPMDHVMSRKLLEAGISPAPALVCDAAVPLKNHLPAG